MNEQTWNALQSALRGAANVYEEMTSVEELTARNTNREEILVACGIFRASELHPAGTRDKIAALEHDLERTTHERNAAHGDCLKQAAALDALRGECDGLRDEYAAYAGTLREKLYTANSIIGNLLFWLRERAGEDSPEYLHALVEVGTPPDSDVSDPTHGGGLAPLNAQGISPIGVYCAVCGLPGDDLSRRIVGGHCDTCRTQSAAKITPSEKHPCPLCQGSGQYINTYGNPVFPCNACGGDGMVD